jgi:hypothetical protein
MHIASIAELANCEVNCAFDIPDRANAADNGAFSFDGFKSHLNHEVFVRGYPLNPVLAESFAPYRNQVVVIAHNGWANMWQWLDIAFVHLLGPGNRLSFFW